MNRSRTWVRKLITGIVTTALLFTMNTAAYASGNDTSVKEEAATGTVAASSDVNISDGSYEADGFGWSGGSGRLEYIKCTGVTVKEGKAYADLEFASENYDTVKTGGKKYARKGDGNSRFTIPVKVNENTKLSGRTTAMSQPHWIEYEIYLYLAAADPEGSLCGETKVSRETLAAEAPAILGLPRGEAEGEAQFARLYDYGEDRHLLQIDIGTRSVFRYEDSQEESLYHHNVVNYLLAPEDAELPAGLEKELVIVRTPAEQQYEIEDAKKVDYPALVKGKTGLVILPAGAIRGFLFFKKGKREAAEELEESLEALDIPLLFDRTATEKSETGREVWEKARAILEEKQ